MDDNSYMGLLTKYTRLKDEFESYQKFAENALQIANEKNVKLEEKLGALSSTLEISKYINSNISNENLIPMINDMIIGILGAIYSSIYIKENDKLAVKATNIIKYDYNFYKEEYLSGLDDGEPFVINSNEPLFSEAKGIHSVIGVPINLGKKFIGYIIVEHTLYNFFSYEHIKFISPIANQIGIALENNFLYKKVVDSSIRDPLMGIFNRKYFFNLVENKILINPDKSFGIVMVDIDDFKKINDVYGHQFGDEVLIQICNIISNSIGKDDFVARYGGEEIIIYIDDVSNRELVFQKIDDIRIKISENVVKYGNIKASVTASFGISYYVDKYSTLTNVLKSADDMCYCSKKNQKNRVTCEKYYL